MGTKYFTLLTRAGELKLAKAISTGKPLQIALMGVVMAAVYCQHRIRHKPGWLMKSGVG